MILLLLLTAIMSSTTGNFSSSPNQSPFAHKQNKPQHDFDDIRWLAVAEENDQSGEPAETSAIETPQGNATAQRVLVVVGIITCFFIGVQSWYTRISARDARDSIKLTHRPKIIIRSVVIPWIEILNRRTPMKTIASADLDAEQLGGFFYAVNIGNQPATIIGLDEYMLFTDRLPMERPYESGKERRILNIKLQPGEACKIPFTPKRNQFDGTGGDFRPGVSVLRGRKSHILR